MRYKEAWREFLLPSYRRYRLIIILMGKLALWIFQDRSLSDETFGPSCSTHTNTYVYTHTYIAKYIVERNGESRGDVRRVNIPRGYTKYISIIYFLFHFIIYNFFFFFSVAHLVMYIYIIKHLFTLLNFYIYSWKVDWNNF